MDPHLRQVAAKLFRDANSSELAAVLSPLVASGDLPLARVRVAAELGDETAQILQGVPVGPSHWFREPLGPVGLASAPRFARWGRPTATRCCLAAVRYILSKAREHAVPILAQADEGLLVVAHWCVAADAGHQPRQIEIIAEALRGRVEQPLTSRWEGPVLQESHMAAAVRFSLSALLRAVCDLTHTHWVDECATCLSDVADFYDPELSAEFILEAERKGWEVTGCEAFERAILMHIRQELAPWLLGILDPLREREGVQ